MFQANKCEKHCSETRLVVVRSSPEAAPSSYWLARVKGEEDCRPGSACILYFLRFQYVEEFHPPLPAPTPSLSP